MQPLFFLLQRFCGDDEISVFSNDKLKQTYKIPYQTIPKTAVDANAYRGEAITAGRLIIFRVLDDRNTEIAVRPVSLDTPTPFVIYSE